MVHLGSVTLVYFFVAGAANVDRFVGHLYA
jgi:hypothetical protein